MTKVSSGIRRNKQKTEARNSFNACQYSRKTHASEVKFLKRIHKLYDLLISVFILVCVSQQEQQFSLHFWTFPLFLLSKFRDFSMYIVQYKLYVSFLCSFKICLMDYNCYSSNMVSNSLFKWQSCTKFVGRQGNTGKISLHVLVWLVFSPHAHVPHILDNFLSSIPLDVVVGWRFDAFWVYIEFGVGLMFTISYCYLIPMQWFLST